jgi:hypothetical protein
VRTGKDPVVTGEHGVQAIDIASRIQDLIRQAQEDFLARRRTAGRERPASR